MHGNNHVFDRISTSWRGTSDPWNEVLNYKETEEAESQLYSYFLTDRVNESWQKWNMWTWIQRYVCSLLDIACLSRSFISCGWLFAVWKWIEKLGPSGKSMRTSITSISLFVFWDKGICSFGYYGLLFVFFLISVSRSRESREEKISWVQGY